MRVTLNIKRFNPETDKEPFWQKYTADVEPTDRLLDALMNIKRNHDGSLTFRKSCAHGVCGSDAMIVNGKERLACKTLIQDVVSEGETLISIEPLKHLSVQRDLMVDQSEFFSKYRTVKPFLIPSVEQAAAEGKETIQSQDQRQRFDDPTKCILCSSCFSACPVLDKKAKFLGPAAIVQGGRFVFDSRDIGLEPRMDSLDDPDGVWPCENHFECTRVCPRGIKITKLINLVKREIRKVKEAREEPTGQDDRRSDG
jgi:succinate dehydrogenase / fumarate reductase iron-sulfur subunit